ncbi:helix-turn-helix domain-containing protein [Parapedobacter koreensis]|uniref:helix-turn-helix domain-containing protein n=1 Tax=Parapedobacter koreensis TaxID=332977 RepID=UPI0015A588B9|nr:helix-turn-helix domain-containing protein [Parapedobacter koreensis]
MEIASLTALLGFCHADGASTQSAMILQFLSRIIELFSEAVELLREIAGFLRQNHQSEPVTPELLRDAKYAAERIGVVDRTLRRLTRKGMLPIHSYVNRRRRFRENDIERCRRFYRGE